MADTPSIPFSARNTGAQWRVDNDFPQTARLGLVHILSDLVDKQYVGDWAHVLRELRRLARQDYGGEDSYYPNSDAKNILMDLPWQRVFDFCERLYSRLAQAVGYRNSNDGEYVETASITNVQQFIEGEIQLLFLEEGLAFDFRNGVVQRRGRRHTVLQTSKAEMVLGDPKLGKARKHYEKALQYFRDVKKPDCENAVKEAVCAVEAAAKVLFPDIKGSTLDDVIKAKSGNDYGQIPKPIAKIFFGLYGYRGSGDGVAHGGAEGGPATPEVAEFVLATAASQIIYLVDLATPDEDVPF